MTIKDFNHTVDGNEVRSTTPYGPSHRNSPFDHIYMVTCFGYRRSLTINRETVHGRQHIKTTCNFCATKYTVPGLTYHMSGKDSETSLATWHRKSFTEELSFSLEVALVPWSARTLSQVAIFGKYKAVTFSSSEASRSLNQE